MENIQKSHLIITLSLILIGLLSILIVMLYMNHDTLAQSFDQIGTTVEVKKDLKLNINPTTQSYLK